MKKLILVIIITIAAILRLVNLTTLPAGFNADEAALAYNAYSLLQTGKDEHGHPWPVNLESFGDFKPAGYTYLLLPFIKVLGLNEFATRLPSALFGILAVYLIYKLAQKTVGHPYIAAAVLAVSPWHIHFSRGAWEVNVATTLILAGVLLFLNNKTIFSSLCLIAAMYTYQSARVIAPLIGLGLIIFYWRQLKNHMGTTVVSAVVTLLCLAPLMFSILHSDASSRLTGVGLLADIGPLNRANQLRGQHNDWTSLSARALHNRPVVYTLQFLSNYLDHFDGDFLFVNGDKIERNKVPETGLLYLTDAIFVIIGLVILLRFRTKNNFFILFWLLIAPVAAALTFQTPHALRAHNLVIPLSLLTALGLGTIIQRLRTHLPIVLPLLLCVYGWQTARYLHEYYAHYAQTYPTAWEYGFNQLVPYVTSIAGTYDRVIVTDTYDQPYILFLFYSHYSPQLFQPDHTLSFRDRFNFSTVRSYANFEFTSIKWDDVKTLKNTLVIGTNTDIPDSYPVDKIIYFPNKQPAFKIVSLNK